MLRDGARLEDLAIEIASQNEGTIVLRIVPSKTKEGVLGFEIANLQDAVNLCVQIRATTGECQLRF